MKTLTSPLKFNDKADFKKALNKQRKSRKAALVAKEVQATAKIDTYRTDLSGGAISAVVLSPAEHKAYYDLYASKAAEVVEIKKNVIDLYGGMKLCPYCQIDTHKDLDHFYPRKVFPELSISSQNLVPACSTCNSTYKKTKWGNGSNRSFIHPYFDMVPEVQFLFCTVSLLPGKLYKISYWLKRDPLISISVFELILRHFVELNLESRYIAKASSEEVPKIERIIEAFESYDDRLRALSNFVNQQCVANLKNTWAHAFHQALFPHVSLICR